MGEKTGRRVRWLPNSLFFSDTLKYRFQWLDESFIQTGLFFQGLTNIEIFSLLLFFLNILFISALSANAFFFMRSIRCLDCSEWQYSLSCMPSSCPASSLTLGPTTPQGLNAFFIFHPRFQCHLPLGQGIVERFAHLTKGNSSIIIVGRNRAAAETIFASLPLASSQGTGREFIQCDASLMSNVYAAFWEILSRHTKINNLVLSPGIITSNGRDETSEGIDKKLAVHYYARWRFIYIHDLLPCLERTKEARKPRLWVC